MLRKQCGKITSNFYFSLSVFKRLVLQTPKNQGLSGKGLKLLVEINPIFLWILNPLPDMPILGSSNSTANKVIM